MFELSQLRCFVAVAEELHFGRAAERLHLTQPPVSRQVQVLERILDVALLNRTSRAVRLTPAGRRFLVEARRILRLSDEAAATARRVAAGQAGSVTLGFTAAAAYRTLPDLVRAARARLPEADILLKEMVSAAQAEALGAQGIDLGLMRPPLPPAADGALRIARETLVAALPDDHPLATGDGVAAEAVAAEPLIAYAPDEARYFHDLVGDYFAEGDLAPKAVQHLAQIHTILSLVRSGLGLALVPESAASLRVAGVTLRPLVPRPRRPVELYLVWRRSNDNPLIPILAELAGTLDASMPDLN
ncbi:LysR family transcriptional regulator [Methylobacterium variabile]|jgi:DNA-binding transcriptional LysR family regulator|uniref:LysR family transcriptional regulator n=1 Tax=Methylobacterium variabile TaxID=298794 RepID=A0A0J6S5W9_9HYPH|nr:LysR family transcriptional regulator [Methylobacterium variabile]KMO30595.1 LysR family transcriptional regulator [Methylobacterium variabile]